MSTVPLFVSYAHKDHRMVQSLMGEFQDLASACTTHRFDIWWDRRIACGTPWDQSIRDALARAKVALPLVSPAYQTSDYIKRVEEPELLQKTCLVVGMKPICFKTMLDPTLGALQFHRLQTPMGRTLFYSECTTRQQREAFVHGLYQQIIARL